LPFEADAPLVIDADTVLSLPIAAEFFQVVVRWEWGLDLKGNGNGSEAANIEEQHALQEKIRELEKKKNATRASIFLTLKMKLPGNAMI
jgi:hypothetical protein